MKTLQECMSFLGHLETRLPVNDWTLEGVRIWPLVRTLLFHRLNLSLRGSEEPPTASTGKAARLLNSMRAPFRDPGKNLPRAAPADVFILTYAGIRQARVGGEYVDIRTGPLIEELGSRKLGWHAWEYAVPRLYRFPRRNPTHLIQREFYAAQFWNLVGGGTFRQENLAGYHGFCEALQARQVLYPELLEKRLRREFSLILSLRDRFERAFDVIHPSVAFTSNMGRYEFALNLACRRRNILTVELQHGAFALHGQYASWRKVPPEGYDLLPDAFWCCTAPLADEFRRRGIEAEFERASSSPLPQLLSRADLHLTHSSSTVLEAQRFGLGSIVWSELGASLYASQIDAGTCRAALDAESLIREIGKTEGVKTPRPDAGPRRCGETLDQFLELGRRQKSGRP
ncbi:MAG: hypothetical protein HY293_19135 [Planctomycetes bacterium]|nr:hypothetical protein [Planctomycetota bacterium]